MQNLSPLAYVPRRGILQSASVAPVVLYFGAYLAVAFLSSDPLILLAATAGAALAGYGCRADRAVKFSLRLGLGLAIAMILVNALATDRGATVLARLGQWPMLGRIDVTLESITAGAVIGMRVMASMMVIGVFSACVDPDRMLRALHRVASRSALTATLISRLVPMAATDQARLSEAATQRGPAATPVGRAAMAHRLMAGSLDRAVDVAATLELRGYGISSGKERFKAVPSRYDRRMWLVGGLLAGLALVSLTFGEGNFRAYPELHYSPDLLSALVASAFVCAGLAGWRRGGRIRGARN